ncbi:hypothetical protein JW698_03080 [Candidatus Wolfebacteria bacterium]|nr:hypothetical protein [Candidatus Wolfebacteria bacterium]
MTTDDKVYFSDIFGVKHTVIEKYGALDISLVCDNPAFVDPFLIFANSKYKNLHDFIIDYLKFLKDLSFKEEKLSSGNFKHYYKFPEVKQAWLGYSVGGNVGLGLGKDFAESLYKNLHKIFSQFGNEKITESSHLEKLCLVEEGVGVDKISDFTINLVKRYLLDYTQTFAKKYINQKYLAKFSIRKVNFDFKKGIWTDEQFILPKLERKNKKEFVLLIPQEILTKEDTWISKNDFLNNDTAIFNTIANDELRTKINKFFFDNLAVKLNKKKQSEKDYSKKSKKNALVKTVWEFPEVLDYYIKYKELNKDNALKYHIAEPEFINFFSDASALKNELKKEKFDKLTSFDDCISRILFFKQKLESNSNDLYFKDKSLQEKHLRLMFKNVTYGALFDYNSEVNNGRGPIDFLVSYGSQDKIGLELKLASNPKLKHNLLNQGEICQEDSNLKHVIKIIFYFSDQELSRINDILREINKSIDNKEIFAIDCRKKVSASNQK